MQLKALGIDNIMGFDWLASPPPEAMVRALEVLYAIGVLDEDGKLTSPTGFQVAEVPLVCLKYQIFTWLEMILYDMVSLMYSPCLLIFLLCSFGYLILFVI
jgi:hypothetical protein